MRPIVSLFETFRFRMTDETVVQTMYEDLRFECMHLAPLLTFGPAFLLFAPLVLEVDSIEQIVVAVIGEAFFAVLSVSLDPFHSGWMSAIAMSGTCYQLLNLGLLCFALGESYHQDYSPVVGQAMIGASVAYLLFVVCVMMAMMSAKLAIDMRLNRRVNALLRRFGIVRTLAAPLFMVPTVDAVVREPSRVELDHLDTDTDDSDDIEPSGAVEPSQFAYSAGYGVQWEAGDGGGVDVVVEDDHRPQSVARVEAELATWKRKKSVILGATALMARHKNNSASAL